jgi:hypothetical protein
VPSHRHLAYRRNAQAAAKKHKVRKTAWAIGIHTQAKKPLQILYLSYTVDIARSKSATIKRIIESKRYQEVFPTVKLLKNVTSNEYWSIDHKFAGIDTTGEEQFTLCAAGLKGSVTSKRSQLVIIDDPIKSASDIGNPDIRKMMQDNWNAVIAPTMFEGGRAICHDIGWPNWRQNSYY